MTGKARPVLLVSQKEYRRLLDEGIRDIQEGYGYDFPEVIGKIVVEAFTKDEPGDDDDIWFGPSDREIRAETLDMQIHDLVAKDLAKRATQTLAPRRLGYLK